MFVFGERFLRDALQSKVKVFLIVSYQKHLAISPRAEYFPCIEVVELIIAGQVSHFVYFTRPYFSLFFLLGSK